jgi:hypothetical protein
MPANTTNGYPYPLGTDPVADGDDAIHNLANAVDAMSGVSAAGAATASIPANNSGVYTTVTYPVGRFTAAPAMMGIVTTPTATWMVNVATNGSATSGQIRVQTITGSTVGSATTISFTWQARSIG